MKYTLRILPESHRESGVALVYALALLGLLLIMLLGFLSSSILEQRIAYNQSSQVGANLLARSALMRVKSQLSEYAAGDNTTWMAYCSSATSANGEIKSLPAPMVSIDNAHYSRNRNDNYSAVKSGDSDNLARLLNKYLTPDNWLPDGQVYMPNWIEYKVSDGTNQRLTGRVAYVVIPTLGIDPTLLSGTGIVNAQNYSEMEIAGLGRTNTGGTWESLFDEMHAQAGNRAKNHSNWLSLDLLTGAQGLVCGKTARTDSIAGEFYSSETNNVELANYYFTTQQTKSAERAWTGGNRTDLSTAISFSDADNLLKAVEENDVRRHQIAANLVDYMDGDSIPTAGDASGNPIAPANWWATPPVFTGNEKTLYLNQIVPMVMYNAVGVYDSVETEPGFFNITQSVTTHFSASIWAELINMYKLEGSGSDDAVASVKNLTIAMKVEVTAPPSSEVTANGAALTAPVTINLQYNPDTAAKDLAFRIANDGSDKYAEPSTYNLSFSAPDNLVILCKSTHVQEAPNLTIKYTVTKVSFGGMILYSGNSAGSSPIDYVTGHSWTGNANRSLTMTDAITPANAYQGVFLVDWEIADPRSNLTGWSTHDTSWHDNEAAALTGIPSRKDRNSIAKAKNAFDDEEAMDWEVSDDPVELSTAVIRNAPMLNLGELGNIHRGVLYQTLNLKQALDPQSADYSNDDKRYSYGNDAQLLDYVKLGAAAEDYKLNVNAPWFNVAAFGILLPAELTQAQADELQKWIAYKCYNAGQKAGKYDPEATDSKCYPRYIHRGMLANVITDWAKKSSISGDYGKKDAVLDTLIGKIVSLVRCGDAYEYFTVFAVAQTIKDFGGASGPRTIVKYVNGTKRSGTCTYGVWDDGFDEITGVCYLVARIRRELDSCENTTNCQNGIHEPQCTFKVKVLESYILSESDL